MKKSPVRETLEILRKTYPDAKIALDFGTNFQLLVAVILSAQCTDERVNKVTPPLFARFPEPKDFAQASQEEIEKYIFSTGFYRSKAKNIKGAATRIVNDFDGKVPANMIDLLSLPGVARKTANVVLHTGFGVSEGIVVDTHVARMSGRLGWVPRKMSDAKDAVKIEKELVEIIPRENWGKLSHLLIFHGRRICVARKPKCAVCPLNKICPSAKLFLSR